MMLLPIGIADAELTLKLSALMLSYVGTFSVNLVLGPGRDLLHGLGI